MKAMNGSLAAIAAGSVLLSGVVLGEGTYKDPGQRAVAPEARSDVRELDLTAAERRLIPTNMDGTVTQDQFMKGMAQRWDLLNKDSDGNLPTFVPSGGSEERDAGDSFLIRPANENPMG